MKIIKQGRLPGLKMYRATCGNCRCEFTFEEQEAEAIYDQRDGNVLKAKCPQKGCGHEVWVDMKQSNPIHGVNCLKAVHVGTGHLHGANDDTPYMVDGCKYCGRCHTAL